ncbi:MAG: hypothetical protein GX616_09040 [Planctomycetes bacterium]|nr:hypothetical protein [Planctomycetota bacterium]
MPQRQNADRNDDDEFWNPYRWVRVPADVDDYRQPSYRHQFSGLRGRIEGRLEALTPLIIGDGQNPGDIRFLCRADGTPYIPGTSLKGMIRSLVEVVGNACVPFAKGLADQQHQAQKATRGRGSSWQLDLASRMFGTIGHDRGDPDFAGLVRFHDALADPSTLPPRPNWHTYTIAGGNPKPEHHAFYPEDYQARKFYHHKPQGGLVSAPGSIRPDQTRKVTPAPPGAVFSLRIDAENLLQSEWQILLYCLALEESVSVTLSPAALGDKYREPVHLVGPMRHKLGGAKPQGGGSCRIHLDRLVLDEDPLARYRRGRGAAKTLEGQAVAEYVSSETEPFRRREDRTMRELRAMLIFTPDDPRATNLRYPSYMWFQDEKLLPANDKTCLKPTL